MLPPRPIGDEGLLHANRFHLSPTALQPVCNRLTSSPTASTIARRRLCRRACDPLSDSPFLKHRPEPSPPCPPPSLTPTRPPPQDPLKPAVQRIRGRGATGGCICFPDGSRLVTLRSNKVFRSASALDRFLTPRRGLRVWLPPCYDASPSKRYPVLYVHDGQNMMADHESWSGRSWGLDQALKRLIAQGSIESPIVVLIDNVAEEFGPFGLVWRRHPPLLPLSRGGPFESPPIFFGFFSNQTQLSNNSCSPQKICTGPKRRTTPTIRARWGFPRTVPKVRTTLDPDKQWAKDGEHRNPPPRPPPAVPK